MLRVDHAGEHGAVCVYRAQRRLARWTAPDLLAEIDDFIAHEMRHRALFAVELAARGQPRCLSYPVCAALGTLLGIMTGMMGKHAIAATTVAIERVVLSHMAEQIDALSASDPGAVRILEDIIEDEREHHDRSAERLSNGLLQRLINGAVGASTEAVIWIGMRR